MSTAGSLNDRSKKELAEMARRKGVKGFDGMNKDQLVRALNRAASAAKPAPKPTKPKLPAKPVHGSAAKVTRPIKPAPKPTPAPVAKSSPSKPAPAPARRAPGTQADRQRQP